MTLRRLLQYWAKRLFAPDRILQDKYEAFKELLRHDKKSLELISELEEIGHAGSVADWAAVTRLVSALQWSVDSLIRSLSSMRPGGYRDLEQRYGVLAAGLISGMPDFARDIEPPYVLDVATDMDQGTGQAAGVPELVGGKAAALGRVLQLGLPQPRGFVVTTRSFNLFLTHNNLRHRLDELLAEVRLTGSTDRLQELSQEMTAMIRQSEVPDQVAEAIADRLAQLRGRGCSGPWAVRSSAVGEDGENSFAGQYASLLNVAEANISEAYKEILAGKYAAQALTYRIRCGLADQEAAMAVIVMEMIKARTSGVMYTREKVAGAAECLSVYTVAGAGGRLVDGSAEPEVYRFPRPQGQRTGPAQELASWPTAARLAEWGLRLEELFGGPQDIEWCEDGQGNCYILQSRPLQDRSEEDTALADGQTALPELPVLVSGGETASGGAAGGQVFILDNETQLAEVPDGSVLVSATLPPSFTGILERLRAVVAEGGSRASHFASVAREYGLPVIAGLHGAKKILAPGETVTVDSRRVTIYRGKHQVQESRKAIPPTPFTTRLTALLQLISPLRLLDPAAPDFSPQNCGSLHDLVRFAHEKGMTEMFSLVGPSGREMSGSKRLEGDLPLTMHIVDLGEGLDAAAAAKKVITPEEIASPLMRASWAGLTDPAVTWPEGLAILDWEEADRLSGGIVSLKSAVFGSYAAVAREYLHLVLRFGYHFAVLDAFGGEDAEANYINFRFKGGGGNYENRLLRVRLIEKVLTWAGFTVTTRGDLLDAGFQRRPLTEILGRLTLLGIVQGKCRLLDMSLTDSGQMDEMVKSFQEILGRYLEPQEL